MSIVGMLSFFALTSISVQHAFAQTRDDRSAEVRTNQHASDTASARSPSTLSTGSSASESTSASSPLLNDLGSQIKYCVVFPLLNSAGPPIPTFNVPVCPNATSTKVDSGGGAATSTPTGTIGGTSGTSTAATTSALAEVESSGGGGGSPSVSSESSGGGGGPSGQVLGASTKAPENFGVGGGGGEVGMPNAGAGGDMVLNILVLLISSLTALLGSVYLYFHARVA